MTITFVCIFVTQILTTGLAMHFAPRTSRLEVVGMTSIVCAFLWIAPLLFAARHYATTETSGWAQIIAFSMALLSVVIFAVTYKLERTYGTAPASK